jgi:hypothetical protein
MTVNSGTRWLPEHPNLRLKVEAGVPPWGPRLANSRNPSVASKWWAGLEKESSHLSNKVVEEL